MIQSLYKNVFESTKQTIQRLIRSNRDIKYILNTNFIMHDNILYKRNDSLYIFAIKGRFLFKQYVPNYSVRPIVTNRPPAYYKSPSKFFTYYYYDTRIRYL